MKYISEERLWNEVRSLHRQAKLLKRVTIEEIGENRLVLADCDMRELNEVNIRMQTIKRLIDKCEEIGETDE